MPSAALLLANTVQKWMSSLYSSIRRLWSPSNWTRHFLGTRIHLLPSVSLPCPAQHSTYIRQTILLSEETFFVTISAFGNDLKMSSCGSYLCLGTLGSHWLPQNEKSSQWGALWKVCVSKDGMAFLKDAWKRFLQPL